MIKLTVDSFRLEARISVDEMPTHPAATFRSAREVNSCARDSSLALAKARLGARISRILDETGMSVRQAEVRTGVSYVEFSRIRQAKLRRFTIDRLMSILESLGQDLEVSVTIHARAVPNWTAD